MGAREGGSERCVRERVADWLAGWLACLLVRLVVGCFGGVGVGHDAAFGARLPLAVVTFESGIQKYRVIVHLDVCHVHIGARITTRERACLMI